ncbi:polysaccharide biosynthesis protein [Endozoicomonas sp. SM1973]|uniref:Polysaccharide biosynthesis protein n=2 Tax=Spartinivicinus marinus TaxID=2994442 RepID=A0A853I6J4_9GAMM|nr:polysaccharide biosynthesis protein [Spartinivicinus marinus]
MAMKIKNFLLELTRRQKRILGVTTDVALTWLCLWLAFFVRLGPEELVNPIGADYAWLFIVAPLVSLPIFIKLGLYRAVLRYMGRDAFLAVFKAITLSTLVLSLLIYWHREAAVVPRSVVLNYWALCMLAIGGIRWAVRLWLVPQDSAHLLRISRAQNLSKRPVAIYGAGEAGFELLGALERGHELMPVAFVDDDRSIANRLIAGKRVYTPKHIGQMIEETGAREILLAMPTLSRSQKKEILESLEQYPLHVRTVPSISELAMGKVKVADIREVEIADVLGRDSVQPEEALLERCIKNKVVMVTGAGGSIGSELCRQIVQNQPKSIILFEHSEYNLYSIHKELEQIVQQVNYPVEVIPLLGSVTNAKHLLNTISSYHVDTLYHAAAYKHVPIVEQNIAEGIRNNVFGTLLTAQAAIIGKVKHFVLISTDKAVRPTNVMGASKRLAEMVLQALSEESTLYLNKNNVFGLVNHCAFHNETRFTMVRFGNVLGSSGSVIPKFREQVAEGGPITVTHPNITRYFMTIPEASQLVIQAGAMEQGGDVFVLNMGEPVKIVDLAEKIINLSGLTVKNEESPEGDIEIQFTGLRPGEKLYEELLIGENDTPTEHSMIMRAHEEMLPWESLAELLSEIEQSLKEYDYTNVRHLLLKAVTGYKPEKNIVDLLYNQNKKVTVEKVVSLEQKSRQ